MRKRGVPEGFCLESKSLPGASLRQTLLTPSRQRDAQGNPTEGQGTPRLKLRKSSTRLGGRGWGARLG